MAAKTILVIDPDEAVGALLAHILETEGYCVVAVRLLSEATKILSNSHFDLIITEAFGQKDIFAFDPTFLDTLRSAVANSPIVLCSTYPSTDSLRAGDFDLADVVPKPFDMYVLLGKIDRLLDKTGGMSKPA